MMAARRSLSAVGREHSFWLHLRKRMSGLKEAAPVVRGPERVGAIVLYCWKCMYVCM